MGLADMGASVVMVGRDRGRGEAALAEIQEKSANASVDLMLADLPAHPLRINGAPYAPKCVEELFSEVRRESSKDTRFRRAPNVFSMAPCEPGGPKKIHQMRVEARQRKDRDPVTAKAKGARGWARQELAS
jgi:hypothetical protein